MSLHATSAVWFPLSEAQRSRWFLYQLDAARQGSHNNGFTARLHGPLDVALITAALQQLVERHPMLRARFRNNQGKPEQAIAETARVHLTVRQAEAGIDLQHQVEADCRVPFDLDAGLLLKAYLYRCGEHDTVLQIVFDHLAVDGWSYWRLLQEFGGYLQAPGGAAAPGAARYQDYVGWQQDWLGSAAARQQWLYWRDALAGLPMLQLPGERPRGADTGRQHAVHSSQLSAALTGAVRGLARKHASTMYATLLAAYAVLLHRHSGQDDIVIGSPLPGRTEEQWADVVGDFVNPIAVRQRFTGQASVAEVLKSVRNTALRGMRYQDYPFSLLVEQLQLERVAGAHPVFQTMFLFQNARGANRLLSLWDGNTQHGAPEWGPYTLSSFPAHQTGGPKFDLTLEVLELDDTLRIAFQYDPSLFDRSTVERMAGHFDRVLQAMVEDDQQSVSRLNLLDAGEREQLTRGWNDTDVDFPRDALLPRMFEAQVLRSPEAEAVRFEGEVLSYAELNKQANQLAHRLLALGVGPDARVALCAERGLGMLVGLLAILKAGGAYVPLDPDYPAERLAYMLADCAPQVVLTHSKLSLPMDGAGRLQYLDDASLAAQPVHNPVLAGLSPAHLAYVIYTSGSTGAPKGVMIEHRSLANFLAAMGIEPGLAAADVVLAVTTLSFDIAALELFLPLVHGARIILAERTRAADPHWLARTIAESGVSLMQATPATWRLLIDHGWQGAPGLTALVGGEALPAALAEQLCGRVAKLWNMYGPTETTVWSTCRLLSQARQGGQAAPSIGRPIANTQTYILDAHLQPVPLGVAGELYIGGAGLARGYLNRAELTAERFITDPFSQRAEARLYRTGDLARHLADGDLVYLGRNDFQVKIRGLRIELGEIEARLAACEGVREAVVLAREDVPGDKRLVAYLTGTPGSAAELRGELGRHLAEYMLPLAFVTLERLPLTPNGKIDRQALPAPDMMALAARPYAPPQGELEQTIAAIWQDLLGLQGLGRNDHFFELGGHSLLAVQLVSRLRLALGAEVELRQLFEHPVLADFATLVGRARRSTLGAIGLAERGAKLPLSLAQQRLWFLSQLDADASAAYHLPASLRLSGALDAAALAAALDRIVARHEILRTTFVLVDGEPLQRIAEADSGFALSHADLSGRPLDERADALSRAGDAFFTAPFDLARGPLIRAQLLRLAPNEHVLMINQHHIISDGWSLGVLVREVGALYAALSAGRDDPLPPLPIQYADFALWQRAWLRGDALQRQAGYWKRQLAGAPELLALPTDRARPATQSHAGALAELRLSAELSAGLKQLSQRHGTTLFMTLLAAWGVLMARLSGQSEVVVGSPIANRQHGAIEQLMGFFVNTLALRISIEDEPSVAALLARVKSLTLDAYAHADIPFDQVVEALQPPRSLSHSVLFQTMLTFAAAPEQDLQLPGLHTTLLEQRHTQARFDTSLALRESGGVLAATLTYASALYDGASMARLLDCFRTLLHGMVADEGQSVTRLNLLGEQERIRLTRTFNASAAARPPEQLMHRLFEAQAARTPDAPAVSCAGQTLSYAQLNRRANQLAHHLLALGLAPDDRVAICMQRGVSMIVALMAVLKAGAAYVPLDPHYPQHRLAYLLDDSAPVALLTESALLPQLPATAAACICVDQLPSTRECDNPAPAGLHGGHLAYVIYTSGSTGQPKGVMVEHRSLVNLWQALAITAFAQVPEHARIGVNAAISFDASLKNIVQLLSGHCLLLIPQDIRADGAALARWLVEQQIDVFDCTPSQLELLCQAGLLEQPACAGKTALIGGEAIGAAAWQRLQRSGMAAFNVYGPTECTVDATIAAIHGGAPRPHIGRPIANAQLYILDPQRQVVPIGTTGEIYIGGAGVARGYLNRPELSNERFIANPFGEGRLYRTGDVARWLADGTIDYLGRNDFQVKLRGFRVELGEIEACLAACDGVEEAVVLARAQDGGELRLVAYLTGSPGSAAQLRGALARQLPEHMLPAAYVTLERFPLTPNGKLDRAALPAPDAQALASDDYVAPQGATEQALAEIWQQLLDVPQVGRRDSFFALGGHSLLAVQLISRIRSVMGVEVGLRALFAFPVLHDFASQLALARQSTLGAIAPADRNARLPLSWAQQRLWFLDRLDSGAGAAYHLPAALRLSGALDTKALEATLDRIVARHENLRTTFVMRDGEPQLAIGAADAGFALRQQDMRALAAHEQHGAVERLCGEFFAMPFDLAQGPLIRGLLLRLDDGEHMLLVDQHHIITDGWSNGLLVREVSTLYTAFSTGGSDPLAPLAIQYADYAQWQRNWLQGETLQRQVAYWKQHLSGAPELLALPTDRARPAVQQYAGANLGFSLPADLSEGLRQLGARHGTTLFMTLLTAWGILMSRLSGQADVVVGSPVANRQRSEIENLIGFFVNTLALRINTEGAPTVAQLLERVKGITLDGYAHQDIPFEQVVEAVKPQRSMSHSPLFQTLLSLNNAPVAQELALPGVRLSSLPQEHAMAQFDLALSMSEANGRIFGSLIYSCALFDAASMHGLLARFERVLRAMVADAQQGVEHLDLLAADEREQVTRGFNDSAVDYPQGQLAHQLFEAQAAQRPQAAALAFEGTTLSYAELNERANELAARLLAMGVRPDERVALCAPRGIELVVGMLAILKSGGAYVPLDPTYPSERLEYMLADSAPVALLTFGALCERLATTAPVLLLDAPGAAPASAPAWSSASASASASSSAPASAANPVVAGLDAAHLAYVIYTSGSTGQPKGVMSQHASLCNLARAQIDLFGVRADSRVLQFASFSFDASISEIMMALGCGATLVMASREALLPGAPLLATLLDESISHVTLPASAVATLAPERLPAGLCLIMAGEACPPQLAAQWAERHSVFNAYGPTEATVCASVYRCHAGQAGRVPIGRPIANSQIYILDARLQPVPPGVAGEIHIGGAGVARAYLNRAELTAERFLVNPFGPGRLYKTGDLACWLADGNIDYLGRNDFQVKIRGFRIELGEIEARLVQCRGVLEAVVLARQDMGDEQRLVAYLTGTPGGAAELRAELGTQLADYMLPAAFVVLDRLPLTSNGKIDRQALPAPDMTAAALRQYAAPQGELECVVAGIWQDLLGLARVGRNDHFFELGGHSLLAVQLMTRIRASLGLEVELRELFAHPVLADFAAALGQARRAASAAIPLADRSAGLPLSWAQQRLWFLDQLDAAAGAAYHIPSALRLSGQLDRAALKATLDRLVARHESLRTTFVLEHGAAVQRIAAADCGFALAEHDLRHLGGAEQRSAVERIGVDFYATPFDLAQGPLIRSQLLRLGEDAHLLLFNQHHIITDGWSIGVLVREVASLYAAFRRGQTDPLAPLALQYADYAVWQRAWLQGPALQAQADYWKRQLAGAPELLALPSDFARPATQSYAGASVAFEIPAALGRGLKQLGQRHGATLFMTLLAGWGLLMARMSGQSDVVVGSPIANRQRGETEHLIGFFANTLALRLNTQGELSVAALLAQVRASTLDAYANQDLPFEQVVEAVKPQRSMSHSPLFQTILTFHNQSMDTHLSLDGLTLELLEQAHDTVQFDTSLYLIDVDDALQGRLVYASALYNGATMARLVRHFQVLLQAMVDDDQQSVHRVKLLSASDLSQLQCDFNATAAEASPTQLVHQLFEAQAARTPEAEALRFQGSTLSYAALNARANQLAHSLIAMGLKPDDRVALYLERGIEMVVGLLGVLKAGGAYVPLDAAAPIDRISFMLGDCAPAALLTQDALQDNLPALSLLRMIVLDDDRQLAKQPTHNPLRADLAPSHLAYVIYTSGSTGQPKGVMVPHAAVCHYLHWAYGHYQSTGACHAIVSSPLAFDATVTSVYLPLMSGGSLHLIPEGEELEGLEALFASSNGALVKITPAHLALLGQRLQATGRRYPAHVFVVGGEALPAATAALWRTLSPSSRIINEYGPTETVVGCITYEVDAGLGGREFVPIGRPIANTQIHIVDAGMQPVPLGVVGEIYIGGAGVTRGYLNRPELTAERFLVNPFGAGQLYKTGDLGRWLADGNIDYLGRNDFQVKIRGYRIELGEIEARLAQCDGVREAVVLAREDQPGEKRLVAYLSGEPGSPAELRAELGRHLAEYMLPAAFVTLDSMPLTANGKLDRKALPAPDMTAMATHSYAAPQGELEQSIAAIWQTLLGVERVGRNDDFFELGGHSLLAVQLMSRLREVLGIEVVLRELFAHPLLCNFAQQLALAEQSTLGAIPLAERGASLPLSWAQQRLWFLDQLDPAAGAAYHIPAAFYLSGELDTVALKATLDRLVARHESLRTTFVMRDGQAAQHIGAADTGFALSQHDLLALDAGARQAAIERLRADFFAAPFDLAAGPLIRGQLLRLGEEQHMLMINQHHIVTDAWSLAVMVREVSALYAAFSQGRDDPLAPLAIQYADYAAWQRGHLQGETLQARLDYWTAHLTGAPELLALPSDHPRPAVQSYAGAHLPVHLPAALSEGIKQLSARHGVTVFMTLLGAWGILMARMSGQGDVVIGSPIANRQRSEIENLIGFFVNTLALRVDTDGEPSVAELLERVKSLTLNAYAHQDIPFEQVVEALKPTRSLSHSPLFQTMFSWNNAAVSDAQLLPGLRLSPVEQTATASQFDLSLTLAETAAGIGGVLEYATGLFEADSMRRLLGYFQNVLEGMVADPAQAVSRLALVGAAERTLQLETWNASAHDFPLEHDFAALFAQQVARDPSRIAASCGEASLSYGELDARAARVAKVLLDAGAGRDVLVTLVSERNLSLLTMMVAVLKAGAAFLPLDVKHPPERLREIVEMSGSPLLLVAEECAAQAQALAGHLDLATIVLEQHWCAGAVPTGLPGAAPGDLAYVIFTSGSTGKPKGAMVEQLGMLNHMFGKIVTMNINAQDGLAQTASAAFDICVWQMLSALLVGGRTVVLPDTIAYDPSRLLEAVEAEGVTLLQTVPSMMRSLLDGGAEGRTLARLRYLIPTGEALGSKLSQDWFTRFPAIPLMNVYGPAECSDDVTWHAIDARPDARSAIPIGRPTPNNRIYILDRAMQPVPIGVKGEICVGGLGVGRGYLNSPQQTAAAFIDHPLGGAGRLYRTGDLGSYRADGLIDFHGRLDFQVKIRGFRIELGEIEARLAQCAGVHEALVLAREDVPGDKRLVAYLTGSPGGAAELRAELGRTLAEYMLPAAFVVLERFPLTPNGKIDRKALPAPDLSALASRDYVAPQGEVEQALAQLWQDLLGMDSIGRNDHFFELGGHSLLAVQLLARIRARFDVDMPLGDLFARPLLQHMADGLTTLQLSRYHDNDLSEIDEELDALSEEELMLLLSEGNTNE
ncbi:non-ribosomal peptide synthase/polyketide synthase [Rugamonas sp. CCM 8940]|uniref:non-ribosomal peptide synthase/polyketide synthase n=1 Tax=Rugamonas sp. CCM 8940 TaxID=2765359 RepID=UPI0018F2FEA9|nr:non-ribosomal peptide synthase/polyketide synthase [Rugamonas sp. CCM 8940]MBJ7312355.1 non-ribosomal peptide synthase/polyketide synthase [Rugamonas sp. CCM 8940]